MMMEALAFAWSNYVKLFFLFCPFFVLNMFLSLTEPFSTHEKRHVAIRVTWLVCGIAFGAYFAGNWILQLFGLQIDGFRIGSGILLMIIAMELALGSETPTAAAKPSSPDDIIVVPLGVPIIMGPACISPIIIMGAEVMKHPEATWVHIVAGFIGFLGAILSLGALLFFSERMERLFGKRVIRIFSKVSGVILMAMAAQMIATGFFTYLDNSAVGRGILEALQKLGQV